MTEKNGDLKYKTDNAIDEAYLRGYEDAKKEFIGMSAKQIQIKYHDDFATALEKMYEYEQKQKESEYHADPYHADFAWDVKTVIDNFRKESE